jgi:hypothetical protein
MRILGLLRLTLPASDPAAVRAWWSQTLGLDAGEEHPDSLRIGDLELSFGKDLALRLVATGFEPASYPDPAGTVVELVEPDYESARRGEESIRDFVRDADDLAGPPVDQLTDQVAAVMAQAGRQIADLLTDVPHNKVLATQLNLGQRAREAMPSAEQWPLHAASTLVSGFVIAGSG